MTDNEVIDRATELFLERDRIQSELNAIDAQIKQSVKDYSLAMKIWGFTPLMLRQACKARGKLAA